MDETIVDAVTSGWAEAGPTNEAREAYIWSKMSKLDAEQGLQMFAVALEAHRRETAELRAAINKMGNQIVRVESARLALEAVRSRARLLSERTLTQGKRPELASAELDEAAASQMRGIELYEAETGTVA